MGSSKGSRFKYSSDRYKIYSTCFHRLTKQKLIPNPLSTNELETVLFNCKHNLWGFRDCFWIWMGVCVSCVDKKQSLGKSRMGCMCAWKSVFVCIWGYNMSQITLPAAVWSSIMMSSLRAQRTKLSPKRSQSSRRHFQTHFTHTQPNPTVPQ